MLELGLDKANCLRRCANTPEADHAHGRCMVSRNILLTKGFVALVDDEDFDWLNQWKWHYLGRVNTNAGSQGYAARQEWVNKTYRMVYMHREILGLKRGEARTTDRLGDHINGDTLDNRRSNLRIVTHSQSVQNRSTQRNNTSGCKGVSRFSQRLWRARIYKDGREVLIGYFKSFDEAVAARQEAERHMFGEYRRKADA